MTMLPYFGKGFIIHLYFVKKTLRLFLGPYTFSYGKLRLQKSVPTQELRTNIVLLGGASLICKMLVFPSNILVPLHSKLTGSRTTRVTQFKYVSIQL